MSKFSDVARDDEAGKSRATVHLPVGRSAVQTIGLESPRDGSYVQFDVAVVSCSCGDIHAAIGDSNVYGMGMFWLGVKFAQLNRWTEIPVIEPSAVGLTS